MDIPISTIVNCDITVAAGGAQAGNFNLANLFGTSNTLTPVQRTQSFANIIEVGQVYATDTEEWKSANIFFSQNPAPQQIYISRWIEDAAAGYLRTNISATALSSLISISDGSFNIGFNGLQNDITDIDLTTITSWDDVAAAFQTAIQAIATGGFTAATCVAIVSAGGVQFVFTSGTTGIASSVQVPVAAGSGTDLVALLSLGTGTPVQGADAETPVEAIQASQALDDSFYGVLFTNALRDDANMLSVAAYVQSLVKIFTTVTNDVNTLNPSDTTNIAYQIKNLGYNRTMTIYTDQIDQYPDSSIISNMFTVDFTGQNTVKTAKFQSLPGISAVDLTTSQLTAIQNNNCNTIISVKDIPFYSDGRMGGYQSGELFYIDTRHFVDWLQDYIQTNMLNLFLAQTVPYTDDGVQMEIQNLSSSLQQGVVNGGLAALLGANNKTIPAYTVLAPPRVATIPLSQRAARVSPTLQFQCTGSDAIHSVTILGTINA